MEAPRPAPTQPIITKLYQMLHALNQTRINFNYTLGFYDSGTNESKYTEVDLHQPKNEMDDKNESKVTEFVVVRERQRRVVSVNFTTQSSMVMRRKPGETGSSAPLLNYIFDTYSNTHQHHRNDK